MSASWMLRYDDLHPAAAAVLRATVLLEAPELEPEAIAAAVAQGRAETAAAIDTLRQKGWVQTSPSDADQLVDDARRWFAESVADTVEFREIAELAGRYASYHVSGLDFARHGEEQVVRWASEHRDSILAAVRVAARAGLHAAAADLAAAAWQVADRVPDPAWWRELARHGEDAAKHARDPGRVFALLNRSAAVFASADDRVSAAKQWVRALKLSDKIGNHEGTVQVLTALADLYCRWGRLDKAMDTYVELVDEHQRASDPIRTAHALTELGEITLAAGEPADAAIYLSRADDLLTQSSAESQPARVHARALEQLGHAQWLNGKRRLARQSFARALTMVGERDEAAADRIRACLDAAPDAPLPASRPSQSRSVPPSDTTQQVQQRGK